MIQNIQNHLFPHHNQREYPPFDPGDNGGGHSKHSRGKNEEFQILTADPPPFSLFDPAFSFESSFNHSEPPPHSLGQGIRIISSSTNASETYSFNQQINFQTSQQANHSMINGEFNSVMDLQEEISPWIKLVEDQRNSQENPSVIFFNNLSTTSDEPFVPIDPSLSNPQSFPSQPDLQPIPDLNIPIPKNENPIPSPQISNSSISSPPFSLTDLSTSEPHSPVTSWSSEEGWNNDVDTIKLSSFAPEIGYPNFNSDLNQDLFEGLDINSDHQKILLDRLRSKGLDVESILNQTHREEDSFTSRLDLFCRSFKIKPSLITFKRNPENLFFHVDPTSLDINQITIKEFSPNNPNHVFLSRRLVPQILSGREVVLPDSEDSDEWVKGMALFFGTCPKDPDKPTCRQKKFVRDEYIGYSGQEKLKRDPFVRPAEIRGHLDGCKRKEWEKGNLKLLFTALNRVSESRRSNNRRLRREMKANGVRSGKKECKKSD